MSGPNEAGHPGNVERVTGSEMSPTVVEVLRFEDLPLGPRGSRRAIVRWSDGSEGDALAWYADEVLVCEGDHGNSRVMSCPVRSPRRERLWGSRWGT
jgi:hypothetical protein